MSTFARRGRRPGAQVVDARPGRCVRERNPCDARSRPRQDVEGDDSRSLARCGHCCASGIRRHRAAARLSPADRMRGARHGGLGRARARATHGIRRRRRVARGDLRQRAERGGAQAFRTAIRRPDVQKAGHDRRRRTRSRGKHGGRSACPILCCPIYPTCEAGDDLEPWFPRADWRWVHGEDGVRSMANLAPQCRVDIAPQAERTLLLVRYFAVVTDGHRTACACGAQGACSRTISSCCRSRGWCARFVPPGCAEILFDIDAGDDVMMDFPWRIRVGVFQQFRTGDDRRRRHPCRHHTCLSLLLTPSAFRALIFPVRSALRNGAVLIGCLAGAAGRLAPARPGRELGPAELPLLQPMGMVARPARLWIRRRRGAVADLSQSDPGPAVLWNGEGTMGSASHRGRAGPSRRHRDVLPVEASDGAVSRFAARRSLGGDRRRIRDRRTSSIGLGVLGTTMNEWPGTACIAAALYFVARALSTDSVKPLPGLALVMAGFLCGLATGAKFTFGVFAVALCAAILLRGPWTYASLRASLWQAFTFGLAVLAGTLVTAGAWMWSLWEHFRNPIFPYGNVWIKSPWWGEYEVFGARLRAAYGAGVARVPVHARIPAAFLRDRGHPCGRADSRCLRARLDGSGAALVQPRARVRRGPQSRGPPSVRLSCLQFSSRCPLLFGRRNTRSFAILCRSRLSAERSSSRC